MLVLAGCGSSSSEQLEQQLRSGASSATARPRAASHEPSAAATSTSSCGPKPGVAATGTPINIGTIDTKQPGTDFSDGPNMINAYFACVNANGGVNGHPVKLFVSYDQTQPAQIAAAAKQLIQTDHVVGIVGVFDLLECTIDQSYWKQLGIYEMGAGHRARVLVDAEQRRGQHGPALQLRRSGPVRDSASTRRRSCSSSPTCPGTGYIAAGPAALAKAARTCRSPS